MMNLWPYINGLQNWALKQIAERKNWGDVEYWPYNECVGVKFIRVLPGDEQQPEGGYFARAYPLTEDGAYDEKAPFIVLV